MHLNYDRGVDVVADTVEVAMMLGYIDNYVQGMFRFVDVDTGEILLMKKIKNKNRGKKNVVTIYEKILLCGKNCMKKYAN